jgi:nitrous oxidase accessory protein NosD
VVLFTHRAVRFIIHRAVDLRGEASSLFNHKKKGGEETLSAPRARTKRGEPSYSLSLQKLRS